MPAPRLAPGDEIEIGFSGRDYTPDAIADVLAQVRADEAALVLVFYGPTHDERAVASALRTCNASCAIAGSTAGELSCAGFTQGTMSAVALHGPHVRAASTVVTQLRTMSLMPIPALAQSLARQLGRRLTDLSPRHHTWLLLFDGMSGREDFFTPYFARHAPKLPIVGGSFADGGSFDRTTFVADGRVRTDAVCVLLLEYERPFELLHHTHMEFSRHWHRVTKTRDGGRTLVELDGRPARDVFAAALDVDPADLPLAVTGRHPFGYRFKGRPFPCSIMRAGEEGFLLAYSVQVGDQLNLLQPVEMVQKSRDTVAETTQRLVARGGEPRAALLFHCLGRYLEAKSEGTIEPLFEALAQAPLCGLNTYGEQFGARHMNHSLTGIIFG